MFVAGRARRVRPGRGRGAPSPRRPLEQAVRWLAYTVETEPLMNEIDDATARISALVGAAKQYSQLDRAPYQVVDLHELPRQHADDARAQARRRASRWSRTTTATLPPIPALRRRAQPGVDQPHRQRGRRHGRRRARSTVRTARDGDDALRRDRRHRARHPGGDPRRGSSSRSSPPSRSARAPGSGSTSPAGSSSTHHGDLRVDSEPGDTRFQVRLPLRSATGG